eukprot:4329397-Heterocapsa_arctica.AAC.1
MLRKCSYSPLQVVTGQDSMSPSALVDQLASGRARATVNHEVTHDAQMHRMERIQAQAMAAF